MPIMGFIFQHPLLNGTFYSKVFYSKNRISHVNCEICPLSEMRYNEVDYEYGGK